MGFIAGTSMGALIGAIHAAVATDIVSGEEVAIRSGDVIDAVRASISVPGIFTPVRGNGRILVDGGLTNPVPVGTARAIGADIVRSS